MQTNVFHHDYSAAAEIDDNGQAFIVLTSSDGFAPTAMMKLARGATKANAEHLAELINLRGPISLVTKTSVGPRHLDLPNTGVV
jgi:hypothetical protein